MADQNLDVHEPQRPENADGDVAVDHKKEEKEAGALKHPPLKQKAQPQDSSLGSEVDASLA